MDQILRHLTSSKRVLLASHRNPDGDAIGSLIAMGLALEASNKTISLYNESSIPAVYQFLPSIKRITNAIDRSYRFDTAIILDCGDLQRIGSAITTVTEIPFIINVDHHITNTGFGHFKLIDTHASATAEIVYHLIKEMEVPINKSMATCIYTGILTDTGSFRFANTNQAAFAICKEMTERGVKPYHVARHVYGTYSLGRIKLLNLALDTIEISSNGKLSMMTITQDMLKQTGTQPEDIDGLINYARRIKEVKVAALIQEHKNGTRNSQQLDRFHVSLRSDGTVDVAAIAAAFGGGGHFSAAGFGTKETLSNIKTKMINLTARL